jgi:hypothetical protein
MDKYNNIIKVTEEDFQGENWGFGMFLRRYFSTMNSGTLKLEFPDTIEEILSSLVKDKNNNDRTITYENIFKMKNGHICKNPIITLKKREVIPSFTEIKYVFNIDISVYDEDINQEIIKNYIFVFEDMKYISLRTSGTIYDGVFEYE